MTQIILDIPDDMIKKLEPLRDELPQILALGLQQIQANPTQGFSGLAEILEFLAQEKNKTDGLNNREQRLWQQYEFVEHLVRMAKARALTLPRSIQQR
jgi:hypothetical protein